MQKLSTERSDEFWFAHIELHDVPSHYAAFVQLSADEQRDLWNFCKRHGLKTIRKSGRVSSEEYLRPEEIEEEASHGKLHYDDLVRIATVLAEGELQCYFEDPPNGAQRWADSRRKIVIAINRYATEPDDVESHDSHSKAELAKNIRAALVEVDCSLAGMIASTKEQTSHLSTADQYYAVKAVIEHALSIAESTLQCGYFLTHLDMKHTDKDYESGRKQRVGAQKGPVARRTSPDTVAMERERLTLAKKYLSENPGKWLSAAARHVAKKVRITEDAALGYLKKHRKKLEPYRAKSQK